MRRSALHVALGKEVRALRKEHGLTQKVLARRAGVATDTLRRLELGYATHLDALHKVAVDGLGMPLSELIARVEGGPGESDPGLALVLAIDRLTLKWPLFRHAVLRGLAEARESR